jgi:hypothetical protein
VARDVQFQNASISILVAFGAVTVVNAEQPENPLALMYAAYGKLTVCNE